MRQRTCIYCLRNEPEVSFNKKAHVIPKAFGQFNLYANGMECDACNQAFGDLPELVLARDTAEGHLRVLYGVKKPGEFKSAGQRTRMMAINPTGPFKGAYCRLRYLPDSPIPAIEQLDQVGLRRLDQEDLEWFLPNDVPKKDDLNPLVYDMKSNQGIVILSKHSEMIVRKLRQKGYKLKNPERFSIREEKGETDGQVHVRIDRPVVRAMAKIAFSYLAAIQGPAAALDPRFNAIRSFVRYGRGKRITDFASLFDQVVLDGDPVHIVTVHFDNRESRIIAHLSLFNSFKWQITLASAHASFVEPTGHVFDPRDRTIRKLIPLWDGEDFAWILKDERK